MRVTTLAVALCLSIGCTWLPAASELGAGLCPPGLREFRSEIGGPEDDVHMLQVGCVAEDEVPHGPLTLWDLPGGHLWMIAFFANGVPHGPSLVFHDSGRLYMASEYLNGVSVGEVTIWREDGSLESQTTYKNGELQLPFERFASPSD